MRLGLKILYGLYLLILSGIDIRKKKIHIAALLTGAVFAPLFILSDNDASCEKYILGIIPGVVFFFISLASRGQVGMADAGIILCIGICTGIGGIVSILAVSFIAIALTAIFLLATKKLGRKSSLPFIPFLFLGYIVSVFFI